MLSDAELIRAVLLGSRERFAELIERHERSIRAIAFAGVKDHHAAQDVAQDVFVEAYRRLGTLRKPAAFGSWVRKMARNRAMDWWRQRRQTVSLDDIPANRAPQDGNPVGNRCRQLVALADRLPDRERAAVMLYYFDGHNVREVAEITGCHVGTITMRLSRARARLRTWLEELES